MTTSLTPDTTVNDGSDTHYTIVYDTLCGWSYGAAEVLGATVDSEANVEVLHRHIFEGDNAPRLADGKADHMKQADARIHELTGAAYSDAYAANVRASDSEVLDSGLTADAAALVAHLGPTVELELSRRLQQRRFVDGISAQNRNDVIDVLVEFGVARDQAERIGTEELRAATTTTSQQAVDQMTRAGARGVPAVIAHGPDGDRVVDVSQFYDRPKSATEALNRSVGQ